MKQIIRWVTVLGVVAIVSGACGSDDTSSDESDTGSGNDAGATEESGGDAPESDGIQFADLDADDQAQMNEICTLATESGLVPTSSIEPVVEGEGGVPALQDAWSAIGDAFQASSGDQPVDGNALFADLAAAAVPICEDIGWEPATWAWSELEPCSLLTEAQVTDAVGAELLDPPEADNDGPGCTYVPANEAVTRVSVHAPDRCADLTSDALLFEFRELDSGAWWAYQRDDFADSFEGVMVTCTEDGVLSVGSYQREDGEDALLARVTTLMDQALQAAG